MSGVRGVDRASPADGRERAAVTRVPESQAPPSLLNSLGYWGTWSACNVVFRLLLRYSVENAPRLPGPYVVVANHASWLDPFFLGSAHRRRVCYLMSEAFYRSPRGHWFFKLARTIPVSLRGRNRDAIRAARAALARGDVVGIFPEGGLSRDGRLYLGQHGAVSLVLSAQVPVVPAGLIGPYDVLSARGGRPKLAKVTVRFGEPILPEQLVASAGAGRKEQLLVATRRLMQEIAALTGQTSREDELAALR